MSDHFWKLRYRKNIRYWGAKYISKLKCAKYLRVGPLLEVTMSKKYTPLWYETHFQIKIYKIPQYWITFGNYDVEKVYAVVARSTFPNQNVQKTRGSVHFWRLRYRKIHVIMIRNIFPNQNIQNARGSRPRLEVQMSKKCTPL